MVGQGLTVTAGLFATALLANAAPVSEVGTYASAAAIASIVSLAFGLQLGTHVARASDLREAAGHLRWAVVAGVLSTAAILAIVVTCPFGQGVNRALIILLPAVALQPLLEYLTGLMVRLGLSSALALQQLIRSIARVAAAGSVVWLASAVDAPLIAGVDTVVVAVSLVCVTLAVAPSRLIEMHGRRTLVSLRTIGAGTLALVVASATWQVIQRTDLLLIQVILGDTASGRYAVTLKFVEAIQSLYAALMVFSLPMLTSARGTPMAFKAYRDAAVLGALPVFPLVVLVAVYGDVLFAAVFGSTYKVSPTVIGVMCAGVLVHVGFGPTGLMMAAARRHRQIVYVGALVIIVNLALNIALIPLWHLAGGAAASAAALVLLNVAYLYCLRSEIPHAEELRGLLIWQGSYAIGLAAVASVPRLAWGVSTVAVSASVVLVSTVLLGFVASPIGRPVLHGLVGGMRGKSAAP